MKCTHEPSSTFTGHVNVASDRFLSHLVSRTIFMLFAARRQYGAFVGPKTVRVEGVDYTADHILVAVGGRPSMPSMEGAEHCIDSNGFFLLEVCRWGFVRRLFFFKRGALLSCISVCCVSFPPHSVRPHG